MSDLVVMVGRRINCERCAGTGLARAGFLIGPKGPICPDCNGAKFTQEAMPLEEFAKLFSVSLLRDRAGRVNCFVPLSVAPNGGDGR